MLVCLCGCLFSFDRETIEELVLNLSSKLVVYEDEVGVVKNGSFDCRYYSVFKNIEHLIETRHEYVNESLVAIVRSYKEWSLFKRSQGWTLVYVTRIPGYLDIPRRESPLCDYLRLFFDESTLKFLKNIKEKFLMSCNKDLRNLLVDIFSGLNEWNLSRVQLAILEDILEYSSFYVENSLNLEEMGEISVSKLVKYFKSCSNSFQETRSFIRGYAMCCVQLKGTESCYSNVKKLRDAIFDIQAWYEEILSKSSSERLDQYFMRICENISTRTNCSKRAAGALIVDKGSIISTGYNGTAQKITNCSFGGCERCANQTSRGKLLEICRCLHAEQNALLDLGANSISESAILYCTTFPCLGCAKFAVSCGIRMIRYVKDYAESDYTMSLLHNSRVDVKRVNMEKDTQRLPHIPVYF